MRTAPIRTRYLLWLAIFAAGCGSLHDRVKPELPPPPPAFFPGSTYSASLALDSTGDRLWVANTETNTVSLLSVELDRFVKGPEIPVGAEPTCVALSPDDRTLYVTCRGAGTVAVVDALALDVAANIPVGAEPVGCALTPLGDKLFVAVSMAASVAVVDTAARSVAKMIPVTDGFFPFAVAVSSDDPAHAVEKAYVTQFFAQLPAGQRPALSGDTDRGRVGKVTVIDTAAASVVGTIALGPLATGFNSDRRAFGGAAAAPTFAFPNQLNTVVLRGNRGYVVGVAASPDGPVNFTSNTQATVSVFDRTVNREFPGASINLNAAVKSESPPGLFLNTPWGMALAPREAKGLVLSSASNVAVMVTISADGSPSATQTAGGVKRIDTGKNPRSVVINRAGTRAYVHNHVSRDVTVINMADGTVVGTARAAELPTTGTLAAQLLHGEELFNTSRGVSSVATAPADRMSTNGWGSCVSCHPFGWTDTVVWNFGDGPRKTLPLNGIFNRSDPADQRILNYSATCDEVEDFELNIRLVSSDKTLDGRRGLFIDVPLGDIPNLQPKANSGRSPDWSDIVTYLRNGVRSPISPLRGMNQSAGRAPFAVAGCSACHAGPRWTSSKRAFTPPPRTPPVAIANGQLTAVLRQVDTFVAGEVNDKNVAAKGADGFNPPSLLGFWAFPPFFHNGQAATATEVLTRALNTKAHKDAGVAGRLEEPATQAALALFLLSIDDATTPEVQQ
ncbi:MAG: hypothetical protein HY303_12030 [Candidatus Wallbacteria bacterium]|nr:hypothetical protein [Candidatus Wallbacteria bacterium]